MPRPTVKRCSACRMEKSRADFSIRRASADGLQLMCRECRKDHHAAHLEHDRDRNHKYRATHLEQEREYARKYRAEHHEQSNGHSRKYRGAHPEKVRECYRKYNVEHREQRREYANKRRAANPEKAREAERRRRRGQTEKARVAFNANNSKRRAALLAALDPTASAFAIAELYREAEIATRFFVAEEPFGFAVDHIVPLKRGGKHHENNLRLLPKRLNSSKGAKLDIEITDAVFLDYINPAHSFKGDR